MFLFLLSNKLNTIHLTYYLSFSRSFHLAVLFIVSAELSLNKQRLLLLIWYTLRTFHLILKHAQRCLNFIFHLKRSVKADESKTIIHRQLVRLVAMEAMELIILVFLELLEVNK